MAIPPLISTNELQPLGKAVVGKILMRNFKSATNDRLQYTIVELPATAGPTASGVFTPVSWTALGDYTFGNPTPTGL